MRSSHRLGRGSIVLVGLVLLLSGCGLVGDGGSEDGGPTDGATSADTSGEVSVDSQFTRDGTFQSHLKVPGADDVDFVYTLYPTKSTPRTNEWYPRGKKYFSFTFQAYDLARGLRDPFATKRKVYLDTISVTSRTITADGGATQHPYSLDAEAATITFDPQPARTRNGMLITSPKGAFELRNQAIAATSPDTRGVELSFTAVVYVQRSAGAAAYDKKTVKQTVPIAIFASDEPTQAQKIPVDAN